MKKVLEVGTTVLVTDKGAHSLKLFTEAVVKSHDGGNMYSVTGEGSTGDKVTQRLSTNDFSVLRGPKEGEIQLTNGGLKVGTKVEIIGGEGHFFQPGTIGTIKSLRTIQGKDYLFVHQEGGPSQLVEESDVKAVGTTKTKGDDTLTNNTFTVGQQVRVTGADKDHMASMIIGQDVATHALPIGSITTIVEIAENGDDWAKVSVEGITLTHGFSNPGPQWIPFGKLEDATGEVKPPASSESAPQQDLSSVFNGDTDGIEVGDEVIITGNAPCLMSKMLLGKERGVHGVPTGAIVEVLEIHDGRVVVNTKGMSMLDEAYVGEQQSIPASLVMKATGGQRKQA